MPNAETNIPSPVRRARLFRNGRNQAVRIPREFELTADEVIISREEDRLVVVPVHRPPSLADVLSRLKPLDEDFPNIADPATKPQDLL
ncbi:MAG: AbrB/MazE/SpoVT family DNA-binding domain-containing protein [Acidobacteria bacterium]|nr:AbrB/MazE/SpoVT family DNA-binding domain-containing protein [Acidobacteriota bacterium]